MGLSTSSKRRQKMIKLSLPLFLAGACLAFPHHQQTYPLAVPHHAPIKQPSVHCKTEYTTVWDTEYKETETQVCTTEYDKHCKTEYQTLCLDTVRTECQTVHESKCETIYNTVCLEQYRTEYEPFIESECTTQYKKDCEYRWEGEGNSKIWAPIPGTCKENPYDECKDVPKTKERQVAYPVCSQVPQEKCVDQPHETCQDIPRENCHNEHKKVPVRVSRKVPKNVCIHTDNYPVHQAIHAVHAVHPVHPVHPIHPVHPVLNHHHAQGAIPVVGTIIPSPAPAIAILPNVVIRTPKAAKDREETIDNPENVTDSSEVSSKLVQDQEEKEQETTEKPKSSDAVVFRN